MMIMVSAYSETRSPEEIELALIQRRNDFIADNHNLISGMKSAGWRDVSEIHMAPDEDILVASPCYGRSGFYKTIASKSADGSFRDQEYDAVDIMLWREMP